VPIERGDAAGMLKPLTSVRRHPIRSLLATLIVVGAAGLAAAYHHSQLAPPGPPQHLAHHSGRTRTTTDSDWVRDSKTGLLVNSQTSDVYDTHRGLLFYAATGQWFDPDTGRFLDDQPTDPPDRSGTDATREAGTDQTGTTPQTGMVGGEDDAGADVPDTTDSSIPDKALTPSDWPAAGG
jgi:hypothetical protein